MNITRFEDSDDAEQFLRLYGMHDTLMENVASMRHLRPANEGQTTALRFEADGAVCAGVHFEHYRPASDNGFMVLVLWDLAPEERAAADEVIGRLFAALRRNSSRVLALKEAA